MDIITYKIYNDIYKDIVSGKKTIEFRLLNEKSISIQIGDEIKFEVVDNKTNFIIVNVLDKYIYENINELWNSKEVLSNLLNYTKDEFINAFYNIFGREKVINSKIIGFKFKIKKIGGIDMKEKYDNWTKEFMESWKRLDWKRTLETLDKNVKYYENPIDEPCKDFNEVVNLWNVVADNQKDIDYKYNIVAYNEDTCIINWQMTRTMTKTNTIQKIDGIFQISLNEKGKCNYFKQWRFTR